MRLPTLNKPYWASQLAQFTLLQKALTGCKDIEYGKQDIRGTNSITWVKQDLIVNQIHFESKDMLLGYVQGYLESRNAL